MLKGFSVILYCRKNTVFGKIILGNDVLKRIELVDVDSSTNMPLAPVRIVDCGELVDGKSRGSVTTENGTAQIISSDFGMYYLWT
jgi:peptidyl-prolyl isomerase G (cyclophilin G)